MKRKRGWNYRALAAELRSGLLLSVPEPAAREKPRRSRYPLQPEPRQPKDVVRGIAHPALFEHEGDTA